MKNDYLILLILFFVVFSKIVHPQLDSVYHQGPSQGIATSGVLQSTDNFPSSPVIIQGSEMRDISNTEIKSIDEPSIIQFEKANLPPYVYLEDPGASPNSSIMNDDGGVLVDKFPGFAETNAIPPDPSMAVGPNHIVATVNGFPSLFRILDKQGNVLKTINVTEWFSPVSQDESGDGQVIYDQFTGRWVLNFIQVNMSNQTSANLFAYSDDDDPNGNWYIYRFDTKKHGTVQTNTWGDYPHLGYDDEAIYITTNTIGFDGLIYGTKLRVIKKSELYNANGGPVTWWDFWDIRIPNVFPPFGEKLGNIHASFSYTEGQNGYLFYSHNGGANWYIVFRVLNPVANPPRLRGKQIPSSIYYSTPNAVQLDGGVPIEAGGSITKNAPIIRDGRMYVAHSTGNTISPTQGASAKYVIVDLNTPAVIEEAELGAIGYYYFYPALTVDENHNIGMIFTRSANTEYAGAYFSTKRAADPPGLNPSVAAQVGLGNYQRLFNARNRWGDYFAIGLDPTNNHEMFFHTEYANYQNSWKTIIGRIIAEPYAGVKTLIYPDMYDFMEIELGTTSLNAEIIIANYGDEDLVITNIPSTFDDFNLVSSFSFPLTISSFDSVTIEFNYTPTSADSVTVLYPIASNDPDLLGISLSGTGYELTPVIEQTFYASSGIMNNGNILTIDPVSGAGSIIGPSLFNEITSLSINPVDGKMYGLLVSTGSSDLMKINASAGDAHLLSIINIPQLAGIAFDTTGTLYAISRIGEVYTIDPLTGSSSLEFDAVGSYLGVTFHPQTNELWATSRAIAPPNNDLVFKVNLVTGDTTILGHTGLGKQTTAIAFDENSNLFGVIGYSSEPNYFVSINTSTGVGTTIGSIGYQHILGLAYPDKIVTSVGNDDDVNLPSNYLLMQNFPNPFNPSTTIKYSIPTSEFVILKIYDVLGNEVANLVNEEKPAGSYEIKFDASNFSSGIYFYKLQTGSFVETKKMVLMK